MLPAASLAWRCGCGGLLDLDGPVSAEWDALGPAGTPTPLAEVPGLDGVAFKLEYLLPTGSFKDRGAAMLAALADHFEVRHALVDSSGNAGLAAAAALGPLGIDVEVYVPHGTSQRKIDGIRSFGGTAIIVDGDRAATARAARERADEPGMFYASHVYQPWFFHGVRHFGLEMLIQHSGSLPNVVMAPVGNGTMILGLELAFQELRESGSVDRTPPIVAVQSSACAPLAVAWAQGEQPEQGTQDAVSHFDCGPTVAEGIAISEPPRAGQILAAVRNSGGTFLTVDDAAVLTAQTELQAAGHDIEPTAAVCTAALQQLRASRGAQAHPALELLRDGSAIVPLCGSRLKPGANG